jgi:hypothetical protein
VRRRHTGGVSRSAAQEPRRRVVAPQLAASAMKALPHEQL